MRALLVVAAMAALVPACRKKVPPQTMGLALDVGGRGDQSFNDGTLRGLENMAAGLRYTPRGYEPLPDAEYRLVLPPDLRSRPFPHLGIPPPIVLQGKAQEDYEPNLRLLASQGADLVIAVVSRVAGLDGLGVIKAAQLPGKIVIGVDSDQSHVAPANVVTSMVKHADVVVYDGVRDVVQGKFTGGDVALGLAEGAMGLVPLSPATFPTLRAMGVRDPEELTAIVIDVQTLQHAVMTRRVSVPATLEELKAFHPPDPAATGKLRAAKR